MARTVLSAGYVHDGGGNNLKKVIDDLNTIRNMEVGEKKTVEINPEEAYGHPNDQMVNEVPRTQVPEGVQSGDMLQAMTPGGPINVKVVEVKDDVVILDANHPLSGKKLIFDLEVVSIG
jgi:FKBP-type peptidyl-prolyl cis-trans isomerase 2